jgi:hypothetical protein
MNLFRLLCAFLGVSASLWAGDLLDELSPSQQAEVKKGEQILITEDIEGKPWPKVKVYRIIDATPEEVAAVFCDFSNAKSFVPKLLKSEISNRVSPTVVEVDYGVDVPILPDEYYTVRNTIKSTGKDTYKIEWKLLRAVQTKDSLGSMRVEPFGDGKCLMAYHNLVVPGSGMAGLLRGKAIEQMRDTVTAIGEHAESQKTGNPAGLKKQVEALRAALGQ